MIVIAVSHKYQRSFQIQINNQIFRHLLVLTAQEAIDQIMLKNISGQKEIIKKQDVDELYVIDDNVQCVRYTANDWI